MGTPNPAALEPYRRLPTAERHALEAWLSTFYDFQLDWLLDPARLGISCKARQIGLSASTAGATVMWGAYHGELTTIVSETERKAEEFLEYAARHAAVLTGLGSQMAKPWRSSSKELRFPSGGRVVALASSGARGFSGNAVLDEFAYHEHPAKSWDATAPTTTLGGYRLRVISSPNGAGNEFHELWQTARKKGSGWATHELTIEQAIAQGYPVDIEECWRNAKGDPRLFDQMYRCQFLDTELQYIPSDLFGAAFEIPCDNGIAFGGLDIGETRDRTVLTILRRKRHLLSLAHIESHPYTDDELIQQLAAKAFGPTYGCMRLAVDATGLGKFPAKTMRKRYGRRLEPVDFTLQVKEELATGLYDVLAKGELAIPKSYVFNGADEIPLLRDDVHAIRRLVTAAGNVRYDAARTQRGHADRAWSLMLARHAAGRMNAMAAALQ